MPKFVCPVVSAAVFLLSAAFAGAAQPPANPHSAPAGPPLDWKSLETASLTDHVQLTTRDKFIKAGEAYFSPDDQWIIFQAIAVAQPGKEADPFYAMYVAPLKRDTDGKSITGMGEPILVSAPHSANTCGWFDPVRRGMVIFGSTLSRPSDEQKSGFQVGSRKYVWMFPQEMEVVQKAVIPLLQIPVESGGEGGFAGSTSAALDYLRAELNHVKKQLDGMSPVDAITRGKSPNRIKSKLSAELIDLDIQQLKELAPFENEAKAIFTRGNYDAECSFSSDGRFLLYAHIEDGKEGAKADANIYVYDTVTREHHAIIVAPGYDGGPFFSSDGKRICYRSDRKGDDLLQLFVADLKFDDGVPVGITAEYQVTSNDAVNWAPYFHPSGEYLVYGSSQVSHQNYEIFAVKLDKPKMQAAQDHNGGNPSVVVKDLPTIRVSQSDGADVLPVFNSTGSHMMWTSQRGPKAPNEDRASSQIWIAKWHGLPSP